MAVLTLTLLGGFQLRSGTDTPVPISARKCKALLSYLALYPGTPHSRDKLAALLWEESGDAQARHSLRQALASLRRSLPPMEPPILIGDAETIAVRLGAIDVDVLEFERLAAMEAPEALARAAEFYRGELLEGFNPRAVGFDDWLMHEQSRLRERALGVMEALLAHYRQSGAMERAIQLGLRLLALDPLRESVHRTLMEIYAKQGRHAAALKQYRLCRGILQRELAVAPQPATERLYRDILQGRRASALPAAEAPTSGESVPGNEHLASDAKPPEAPAFELRQVTVLSVALAGIDEALDPEEAHALVSRYHAAVDAEIERYGGRAVQRMGCTLLAAFGVPVARSNDAERAVHAADAIRRIIARLMGGVMGTELQARIGVASGGIMVGQRGGGSHPEYTLTGEAVNLAGMLSVEASAGEILLSEGLYHSVAALIAAERQGPEQGPERGPEREQDPKQGTGPRWRLRSVGVQGQVPERPAFVGRRAERRLFAGAVEACLEAGCGQTFLVRGEAGIGKTRLTEEFGAMAQASGFACHKALVLDFGTGTGQDAVRALVRSLLDLSLVTDAIEAQAAAERAIRDGLLDADQRAFLNDLLDLPQPTRLKSIYDAMDNTARQRGKLGTVLGLVKAKSRERPQMLAVEDIHWADPPTLDYLASLAHTASEAPVLLVMTSRVEGEPLDPAWRGAMHGAMLTTVDLGPLREEESLALVLQLTGQRPGSDATRRCIARAGGNPLFLEQLLRVAGERGDCVPGSVQSIVWARLDRLDPSDKQAAQAASVMGQRFDLAALRLVIADPDYTCDRLVQQRLVRPDGPEGTNYLFGHALIQEAIYASLPRSRRRTLHRRAAEWFAERDEVLYAEHLDRADDPAAAQAYLAAARTQASEYHYERALDLVKRGLELAHDRATKHALTSLEGELLHDSGAINASIAAFERALALADEDLIRCRAWIGKAAGLSVKDQHEAALAALAQAEALAVGHTCPEERAQIHYHRGNVLFTLARVDECLREHEQALDDARRAASPLLEARALSGLADAYYQRGRMGTAQGHLDRCIALCRAHGFGRIEAANLAMRGVTRFYQNDLEGAIDDNLEAAALAARVGNQRDESLARNILGTLLLYRGDSTGAKEQAERSLALIRPLGSKRFEAENLCTVGQALSQLGSQPEAEALVETAYALSRESGLAYNGPWILSVLALIASDREKRRRALAEGESILRAGAVSHNYMHFYQIAMEVALSEGAWGEARRYAAALENYTRAEPLPWAKFFIARGRALARFGEGGGDPQLLATLSRLREEAERVGLRAALPAIRAALDPGTNPGV